ncbi:hypothetical protein H6P81_012277 [Aristolochia fimbriata]|uniref:Uncharacterized protein n=1 Tax=Aristolochia fimbriata TaxID=158543 RepID=A0AAV7EBR4_ARIFI|nr:hypothetical protein H6P81_012277 [Aristolochia fimbriata]
MWYLGVTRRFVSPPPTEPTMVYHPRGYTEEALLGCVRNVVERVNRTEVFDPSSVNPSMLEIRHYRRPVSRTSSTLGRSDRRRKCVTSLAKPSHVVEPTGDRAPQASCKESTYWRGGDPWRIPDEVPVRRSPTVPDLPRRDTRAGARPAP